MRSMTGYGKAENSQNGLTFVVEIKTVNNRNFDFNARLPRAFICYEDAARKKVAEYVRRARIDLFVNFTDSREIPADVQVDIERAKAYYFAGQKIADALGLTNTLTVSELTRIPDVVKDGAERETDGAEELLIKTVAEACENLNAMRSAEGDKLVADFKRRMAVISDIREKIAARAPLVAQEYRDKLKERIEAALADIKYDEARLLNEVAFYTDKVNIDEELTRLSSHIAQFIKITESEGEGKKLDFLMQEFNREANTICSKSNDIEVTGLALSLKNEIEKVREQVQNIE